MRTKLLVLAGGAGCRSRRSPPAAGRTSTRPTSTSRNKASLQRGAPQLRQLLPRLPLGQVRALQPHGRRPRHHRAAADRQPDVHRRAPARHDAHRHQPGRRQALVRRRAAGPVADRAQPRRRTTSTRSCARSTSTRPRPTGVQQPGAAGHRDAARAVGAAGHAGGGVGRRAERAGQRAAKHFKEFKLVTPGQADARGVRRVRARHGQLPRLHRRAGAAAAPARSASR